MFYGLNVKIFNSKVEKRENCNLDFLRLMNKISKLLYKEAFDSVTNHQKSQSYIPSPSLKIL